MRLFILVPALSVVTLAAPPALAQDAQMGSIDPVAAVRGFLTDADLLGADSATVGSVTADGETIVATDVSMRWQTTFEVEGETVLLSAAATMDRVEVASLERTDDGGFGAAEIAVPVARLVVQAQGGDEPFSYDFTIEDYRLLDASWNPFPTIEPDPDRPVSRFAPLVDWVIHQSYALNEVGSVKGVVVTGDGEQEIDYGAVSVGPVVDGALESFEYAPVETTQRMAVPVGDGEMETATVNVRYGASRGERIDGKPVAALLTGTGAGEGPQTLVGSMVIDSTDVDAGDLFSMSIGANRIEEVTIDPGTAPLMEALDPLVVAALAGEEPSPDVLFDTLIDVYGAFGVGAYAIEGVEIAGTDFSATMGEFLVEGLSAAGMDLFALRGMSVDAAGGSGAIGAFEVADLVFPEREAFLSAVMSGAAGIEPDLRAVLDSIPYLGRITLSALEVTAPDIGTVSLGLLETRLEDFVAPIPTRVTVALEGLSLPATAMPDLDTGMMMQAIGADPLTADGEVTLSWDDATSDMAMGVDLSVGNVGTLEAEGSVGGIPRLVFENPMRAQEAIATAAIGGLDVVFTDGGLTGFLLGMMSEQTGLDRAQFIDGIVSQIRMQGAMLLGDAALAEEASGAVAAFLSDPQSIRLTLDPAAPVPVAQIMGAAMTAPQALAGLLNVSIGANE